eukprot:514073-Prymnesium_polylepis.1
MKKTIADGAYCATRAPAPRMSTAAPSSRTIVCSALPTPVRLDACATCSVHHTARNVAARPRARERACGGDERAR